VGVPTSSHRRIDVSPPRLDLEAFYDLLEENGDVALLHLAPPPHTIGF
jgi:hypothetical protein